MKRCIPSLLFATCVTGLSAASAQAPSRSNYSAADVQFMSGMIYHHAQAILIAGWAPSHEAGPSVRTLCERIVAAQTDEIALLSRWLADRHEAVPHPAADHMMMPEMDATHMMPGMLSADQLAQLDRARGATFDETFLRLDRKSVV